MPRKKKTSQSTLTIRFESDTPEASVVEYCREHETTDVCQLMRRAMNAFYLPLGKMKEGASADEVQRLALLAIQELHLQALYLQQTCVFDRERLTFAPIASPLKMESNLIPLQPAENIAVPQVNSSDKKATSFDDTGMTSFFGVKKVSIAAQACPFT
ncbi:hypothetical protein C7B80_06150 [Cyanosarcina cf. burmensis CCALA 770]|jgi:hypothetical protein|nr:hypothetical protein C7B80_06150 [Cyanosarcina cf. burmensis CCALA 770]